MDDSVNEFIFFLVWPLPAMGLVRDCLLGALPYTRYQVRDMIVSLVPS